MSSTECYSSDSSESEACNPYASGLPTRSYRQGSSESSSSLTDLDNPKPSTSKYPRSYRHKLRIRRAKIIAHIQAKKRKRQEYARKRQERERIRQEGARIRQETAAESGEKMKKAAEAASISTPDSPTAEAVEGKDRDEGKPANDADKKTEKQSE